MAKKTRKPINEALPPDWKEDLQNKAALPADPRKEMELGQHSAQYAEDEPKRRRLAMAKAMVQNMVARGQISATDEEAQKRVELSIVKSLQDREMRQASAARLKTQQNLPPSPPEPSPEEVQSAIAAGSPTAAQRAAVSDAEEEAEKAAARQRGEEKAEVDVGNQELQDLSAKGARLRDIRKDLRRTDLTKDQRKGLAAQASELEAELADHPQFLDIDVGLPGRPRSQKITYETDPETGEKVTDVVEFQPSDIDDRELRRAGMSPGWTTVATLGSDSKGAPLFGNYRVLDPSSKKLVPGSKDLNTGFSALKDPQHGALRMLRALKADPRYTVRIYKTGAAKGAKSHLHGVAYFDTRKKTANGKNIFTRLGSGTPEEAQRIAEDAAETAGVQGIQKAPEDEAPRGSEVYDIPSVPLTSPGDPDYAPPGGWIEAPDDMNEVEFADADETNPEHPIAWGDFWEKMTPAQIDALHVNPIEIDKHVISNPRLSQAQKNAIQRKLNIAKKMTGRGEAGARFERDLSPSERFGSHKGFASGLIGDDTVEPVVDAKGNKVIDPKTGHPKMKITFGWERPEHSGAIPPPLQKNRAAIQLMVPYLRNYLELLQGWATSAIKPISKDTQFLHQQFNVDTGEEVVPEEVGEQDVDGDAPCGKCGHPATSHAGWPNQALECEDPECIYMKPTRAGEMKYNKCDHYVATKKKGGSKPRKFKQGQLNFRAVDQIAKELATIPSRWGSKAGGSLRKGVNIPPHSPAEIKAATKEALATQDPKERKAALQKVREMNDKVAKWYEEISKKAASGVEPTDTPPHSRKDVLAARSSDPELFKKMNAENHQWVEAQKAKADDKKTLAANLGVLKMWLEHARKNLTSELRKNMAEKWRQSLFGESLDDETDRLQSWFIDQMVSGQTRGISRATGQGKQQSFSGADETWGVPEHLLTDPDAVRSGLERIEKQMDAVEDKIISGKATAEDKKQKAILQKAYERLATYDPDGDKYRRLAARVKELKMKEKYDLPMSKWDKRELDGFKMVEAARPGVDWTKIQKMFAAMQKEKESEVGETDSWLTLGDSILGFINRNAGILSLSGGRGRGADETAWDLVGRDVGFAGDVPAGSGIQSKLPTIRTKAEIEAEKGAGAAAEAEKAAKRRADAIAGAKARGGEFKGSPKERPTAKDSPFDVPVEKVPGQLGHVTGPEPIGDPREAFIDDDIVSDIVSAEEAERTKQIEAEIAQLVGASNSGESITPESEYGTNYGEFQGRDVPGKVNESLSRYLLEIAENSTADKKPSWYDDL